MLTVIFLSALLSRICLMESAVNSVLFRLLEAFDLNIRTTYKHINIAEMTRQEIMHNWFPAIDIVPIDLRLSLRTISASIRIHRIFQLALSCDLSL